MKLQNIKTIYFIGIGGIGMSNLALYMLHIGKRVLGYDKTASPVTESLLTKGVNIHFDINLEWALAQNFDKETTLIVYTPAVKQHENKELDYFITQQFTVLKRSEVLGLITKDTICLAVAGTHGKTTTSTMLAHILKVANVPATSFLGGISENYHTNLVLGGDKYSVVEADEYDRSFLRLFPDYACITATDADHLDIYHTEGEFEKTFQEFADLVTEKLFVRKGIDIAGKTFGFEANVDYQAVDVKVENGAFVFTVKTSTEFWESFRLYMPGRHNVLNSLAATALAHSIGVSLPKIAEAMATFKGVERRFSYRIRTDQKVLIDDYAHHPTELNALHQAVRELYPDEQITIVFQPHTYTRTRDFMQGFVSSLAQYDQVYILPIYAAREHSIEGINSENLAQQIAVFNINANYITDNQVVDVLNSSKNKILLMVGAGDIGEMVHKVVEKLNQNLQ